ncbi:MAG: glycosyltransferase [Bacteroides sp.]|nr:glycosyltransferase [Bacteroides sp.]
MNITHLTTVDRAGSGKAAMRIVQALRSVDCKAILLVLHKQLLGHDEIIRFHIPKKPLYIRILKRLHIWHTKEEQINKQLECYHINDAFSLMQSDIRIDQHPLIHQSNIIHLHWMNTFIDLQSFFQHTKQPVVWTMHDMSACCSCCCYGEECGRYKEKCGACPILASSDSEDYSRQQWYYKNAVFQRHMHRLYIVTPSVWLADKFRESSLFRNAHICVIPNCIDTAIFYPLKQPHPQDEVHVLLGAMDATDIRKGFLRLVRILPKLQQKLLNKQLVVHVVGEKSGHIQINNDIVVKSWGFIESDIELAKLYNSVDLLLYASYRDNLPNMIMEAMACGVPVVAFPIGGIPDMVKHKQTGYCAANEDDYVQGCLWCLQHADSLSQNALKKVQTEYLYSVVANQYQQLYNDILSQTITK